jgi:hypothetical protein
MSYPPSLPDVLFGVADFFSPIAGFREAFVWVEGQNRHITILYAGGKTTPGKSLEDKRAHPVSDN